LLSLAKEFSALPFIKEISIGDKNLSIWITKIFDGTFFSERDSNGLLIKETVKRFDLRAELGVGYELGRQSLPVILNESIVRGFYFIRQLKNQIEVNKIKNL